MGSEECISSTPWQDQGQRWLGGNAAFLEDAQGQARERWEGKEGGRKGEGKGKEGGRRKEIIPGETEDYEAAHDADLIKNRPVLTSYQLLGGSWYFLTNYKEGYKLSYNWLVSTMNLQVEPHCQPQLLVMAFIGGKD